MENRLKELRMEKGLTLDEIQSQTGIKHGTYNNYENGTTEPKLETWQKLAYFFGVSVPYLQGFIDDNISIRDLNSYEQDAYERITDMLNEDYPEGSISQSKIGKLLIDASFDEE